MIYIRLRIKKEKRRKEEEMKSVSIKTIRQITQRWEDSYERAKLTVL